jgi:hypothetical protein
MDLNLDQYINGVTPEASRVPPVVITQEYAGKMEQAFNIANQWDVLEDGNLPYKYPDNIPDYSGDLAWIDPLGGKPLEVDLGDMKELLSNITFKKEGVTFTLETNSSGTATQLAKALRIRIPQLKIGNDADEKDAWVKGEVEGTNVVFKKTETETITETDPLLLLSTGTDEEKEKSQKIKIEIRLVNKVAAGEYKVDFDFNWNTAQVSPSELSDGAHKGEIAGFDLNSYLDDMKDGDTNITVASVPAFLFVEAPSGKNGKKLEIKIDSVKQYESEAYLVNDLYTKAKGQKDDIKWLDGRIKATDSYEFAEIFNAENIKYAVTPPDSLQIKNDSIGSNNNVKKITANLVIVLPMTFKFSGTAESYTAAPTTPGSTGEKFLRVKFADLDKFLEGDSDSGSDGVMKQIDKQLEENGGKLTELTLKLSNIKNDVIDGLYLAIGNKPGKEPEKWHIIPLDNGASANIEVDTASLASLPQIRFLLKEDTTDSNTGILTVNSLGNDAAFNVNISVVAGISLDKKIDL